MKNEALFHLNFSSFQPNFLPCFFLLPLDIFHAWQPLQHSCLGNSTDRGAWRATVHGVTKSRAQPRNTSYIYSHTWIYYFKPIFNITDCVALIFFFLYLYGWDFPGSTSGKEPICQCRRHNETWVQSLGWEDPLEEAMATHSSGLTWRIPQTEKPCGL